MTAAAVEKPAKRGFSQKMLDGIEKAGNKVPHPAVIFLALCLLIIILSAILSAVGVSATYETAAPVPTPVGQTYNGGTDEPALVYPNKATYDQHYELVETTTHIKSLLDGDGVRFLFTSPVDNFTDFGVVGVILVAMIGVGVAEEAGLIGALIRRLVAVAPRYALTFIIVFIGILSSVASDAGYLVLIPLGAVAFRSVGRNPLAGIAAAFAGVGAAFGVNILITPVDGIITEVTNESIHLVDPSRSIHLTSNLYFGIGSTIFLAFVITFITERMIEPRLGVWDPSELNTDSAQEDPPAVEEAAEKRGLRAALIGTLVVIAGIVLLTAIPGAPLRNPDTGSVFDDSPFMASLIVLIMIIFLVAGLCFGRAAGTLRGSAAVMGAITKTFASLGGLIFLLLIIAQFIAYFNYSNMATIAAVKLADQLESANVGALLLLVGLILVVMLLDLIIPGVIPKWAIFAPIFVPLFLRLGVAPQTVLAAYRVGDSPPNVITPLMVYLPFIVLLCQRYKKSAGVGTVVSLMIPYTLIVAVTWILFFVAWYLLRIPLGPGASVHL
ncbi:MAG TPA: AbgT family transporter [Micromonosporaceae bacterium]|jgi:aminobenzoyl-glutamate transport protein